MLFVIYPALCHPPIFRIIIVQLSEVMVMEYAFQNILQLMANASGDVSYGKCNKVRLADTVKVNMRGSWCRIYIMAYTIGQP